MKTDHQTAIDNYAKAIHEKRRARGVSFESCQREAQERAAVILEAGLDFITRVRNGFLDFGNTATRQLFTELTGVKLPPTWGGTFAKAKAYAREGAYAESKATREAVQAKREAKRAEQATTAQRAEEFAQSVAERLRAGLSVTGLELSHYVRVAGLKCSNRAFALLSSRVVSTDGRKCVLIGLNRCPSALKIYQQCQQHAGETAWTR